MPSPMTKQELLHTIGYVEEFWASLKNEITEDNAKYLEIDVAENRDAKPVYPRKMLEVTAQTTLTSDMPYCCKIKSL